ncbi:NAD(P)-dependent oxidoreductase [Candidatus Phycosocius spiralis]|uniref:Dihydrofolate reductase n=1 Tax=Candidatus Phycosocius spiralis TaxID=2815099 RepID=A0ABQ4PTD0_9PROT|nr:NAD(P)-dependent oxidoreductase [Candidatus Phycosocius spiralis]GIU66248.1 dihydrofolate reductase [Candidatus Phycosocius spiralis]
MILIIHPELSLAQPLLENIAPCTRVWEIEDLAAFAAGPGAGVRAIACIGGKKTDAALFCLFPKLEAVIAAGVGVDGVDLAAAKAAGIAVCNSPGINTDDVADLAMGLLIAGERNIIELDRLVRTGEWADALTHAPRYRLRGRTLGILGMGAIGQAIAVRGEAFGLKIIWSGPNPKPELVWPRVESVLELARQSDILMLACPLSEATRQVVSREVLDALGSEGVLINVARGGVVDEPALLDALKNKRILGAGLDVFAHEPTDPKLWAELSNVVLTPHVAGRTRESVQEAVRAAIGNLIRVYQGQALENRVV